MPAPEVWWTLGMDGQRETGGTQLRLNKMTKDVVAVCHGKNNAGEVELVLNVQVSGPGTPPNEIVAMPLPDQALAVEWTAPDEPNGKAKMKDWGNCGNIIYFVSWPDILCIMRQWRMDNWNRRKMHGNKLKLAKM